MAKQPLYLENDGLRDSTKNTEIVIVIGYSFPFFNRETDRSIFSNMPHLKKVYIQDIKPDSAIQSIRAVLPYNSIELVPVSDCSQFFLPSEL